MMGMSMYTPDSGHYTHHVLQLKMVGPHPSFIAARAVPQGLPGQVTELDTHRPFWRPFVPLSSQRNVPGEAKWLNQKQCLK
jgi:hypothetical protein